MREDRAIFIIIIMMTIIMVFFICKFTDALIILQIRELATKKRKEKGVLKNSLGKVLS